MIAYQCLRCRATASDQAGCPSCGAAPDPLGIELGRLNGQLAELDRRDVALRQEYASLTAQRHDLRQRIAQRWAEVARRGAVPAPPGPAAEPPPAVSAAGPVPVAAPAVPGGPPRSPGYGAHRTSEASTRSVQNVLLILGGLLLGVAAIVFTAVAWATFGLVGRAAILATITGVALAVPIALRRRNLTATAETIAAVGLLLVLLDGYAVWAVNLFGVQQLPPSGYAALVFTMTSVVAAAYQVVSRLTGPWYAAVLAVQPVLALVAVAADTGLLGYAAAFAGTAAVNLAVLAGFRQATPRRLGLTYLCLGLFLTAGGLAGLLATLQLVITGSVNTAALAGGILVAMAALGVAAAAGTASRTARQITGGVAAVALVVAVARPVALLLPGYGLLAAAVTTVLVWAAARALLAAPGTASPGPRPAAATFTGAQVACWVTAAVVALPAAVWALIGGTGVLVAVSPVWHTDLTVWRDVVTAPGSGWQPLLVLALLAGGSLLLAPEADKGADSSRPGLGTFARRAAGHHVAVGTLGLVVLGAPAGFGWDWWSPLALGVPVGIALAAAGAYARGDGAAGRAAARGITGGVLLLHTAAASLVRPGVTAAVLALVAAGAAGVAALAAAGHSAAGRAAPRHARIIGGVGAGVALAAIPSIVGAYGVALRWPDAVVVPVMTGGAALALGIAAALRLADSQYLRQAVVGVGVAAASGTLAVLATDQPTGVYAATSGLIGVAAGMLYLPSRRDAAIGNCVAAGVPFVVAVTSVVTAVLAPFQAYLWVFATWQGSGTGTRRMLAPESLLYPGGWDPLTLALITVACGLAAYGLAGGRWVAAAVLPGAGLTLLAAPVAYDWPWPALPVVALTLATAAGLFSGLTDGGPAGATGPAGTTGPASMTAPVGRTGRAGPAAVGPVAPDTTRARRATRGVATGIWPVVGSIGLANCLATSGATLGGLGVAAGTALVVALLGRTTVARVTGWVVAAAAAALLVNAAGLVAGLGSELRPYGVVAVAVLLLGAAAALPAGRRTESRVTEWLSYLVAGFAVAVAFPFLTTVAIVLAGYGAMLGLSAVRPGRQRLVFGAAGCELLAWWVFLHTSGVGVVEAYTVPFAAAALLGGVLELRRRPANGPSETIRHRPDPGMVSEGPLTSWRAYGLALTAGFLPSVAVMMQGDDPPLRRLLLGTAALAVVLVGAVRRRQAPVVVGGVVLVLVALRELAGLWDLLPRWVPLAAAGLVLLLLGATYEQRRRDVRRLRESLAKMS